MDAELIEQLEQRLEGLQDTELKQLNTFEDADLAMYPALEIPEVTHLTAGQCEAIANNLIRMMNRNLEDDDCMLLAARSMASLAYNTFMDVGEDQYSLRPFFHTYNNSVFTEDWLRTCGMSDINLEELSRPQDPEEADDDSENLLQLVDENADDYERIAAIGIWAFCHLRVLRPNCKARALRRFFGNTVVDPSSRMIRNIYGFASPYKFPLHSSEVFNKFRQICLYKRPGEFMYLFYRGAIVLEQFYYQRENRQKTRLLIGLAYGGRDGLLNGGIGLWTQAMFAVRELDIKFSQLFKALDVALMDEQWVKYSASSLKVVDLLREFYCRYFAPHNCPNRYYKYAAVVNHHYFFWLRPKNCQEISSALNWLYSDTPEDEEISNSVYGRWGKLLAEKILAVYPRVRTTTRRQYDVRYGY